ncbi:MAG: glycosyltransferase family protein [Armatimonadetes bacterium]|nr:glycosyltransferase family protein [Armatimonadota bacterium]
MSRTVIIAQARMSSTRLPGKTLADLDGRPVVDRVVERALRSRLADDVAVATTTDISDDVLVAHLHSIGIPLVRGSLNDVLSRYVLAAEALRADSIVRITCDCPLIDPAIIDETIARFAESPSVDYCTNTLVRTYPIGMDTEVFSRQALERAHDEARQSYEREHVTPYLYQHPELFRLRNLEAPGWAKWPELRLTLDEPADLQLIRAVVDAVGVDAPLASITAFLRKHPQVAALNSGVAHRHVRRPLSW